MKNDSSQERWMRELRDFVLDENRAPGLWPRALSGDTVLLEPLRSGGAAAIFRSGSGGEPIAVGLGGDREVSPLDVHAPYSLDFREDPRLPGAKLGQDRSLLLRRLSPHLSSIDEVRLIAYHPHRRAVLKVEGRQAAQGRCLYVKLLRRSSFDKLSPLLAGVRTPTRQLRLALPLLHLEQEAALVSVSTKGESLHSLLARREKIPWASLAFALNEFRELDPPESAPLWSLVDERRAAVRMIRRSCTLEPRLIELAEAVEAMAIPDSQATPALLHGDLHDKQIFIDGDVIRLIDLEGLRVGEPGIDPVNLVEHLWLRNWQGRGCADVQLVGARLLSLLGMDSDGEMERFLSTLTLARLAGVYARRPSKSSLHRRLAEAAIERLDGS